MNYEGPLHYSLIWSLHYIHTCYLRVKVQLINRLWIKLFLFYLANRNYAIYLASNSGS